MRSFFKISVAVHRILLTLDVSSALPMALLWLFYGSSWLIMALLLLALFIHLLRAHIMAHLSLIYRSSAGLLPRWRAAFYPVLMAFGRLYAVR
jgi:hypothetical protein